MPVSKKFYNLMRREGGEIKRRYKIKRIGIFGSCAREEEKKDSDVDLLVEFEEKTFDNYIELKFFLEDCLGRSVDLVTIEALKPSIKDGILSEVKYAA